MICSPWTKGQCIGMRGNSCPSRHFFQDGDRELLQSASWDTTGSDRRKAGTQEEFTFSSPLLVKVRKQVARERREELDLETGRRRSWVETREFELLDLTGNFTVSSPALAHPPSLQANLQWGLRRNSS